jgi:hypothetical protein
MSAVRGAGALAVALALAGAACAPPSYEQAIGYRARQLAIREDLPAFAGLMREAVTLEPETPTHHPPRTVLVHAFDLAGDPRFLPLAEAWLALGWVPPAMTCAIHRARFHHARPEVAGRSLEVVLARARAAAADPDRRWELDACLGDQALLRAAGPRTRARLVREVVDPAAPLAYRRALLEGLASPRLTSLAARMERAPDLDPAELRRAVRAEARAEAARLDRLLDAVQTASVTAALVAAGTAEAAAELERTLVPLGESYFARRAHGDLPWAWVRVMKARDPEPTLQPLGIWDEVIEGEADGFWYVCPMDAPVETRSGGEVRVVPVRTVRRATRGPAPPGCPLGPLPLEASARGAAAGQFATRHEGRVVIRVKEREKP